MLNKEEINYLAMLVVTDEKAFKEFRNNKQKDIRKEIIEKLNKMCDELCK